MKKIALFILICSPCCMFAQLDSLETNQKKNRFNVAGNIIKNSVFSVPTDFAEMGLTITSDWKRTAIYTSSIVGLIVADRITTGFLHDYIEPNIDYKLPKIDVVKTNLPWIDGENAYLLYPIAGLYAGSFLANHEKGQIVALNAFKSITYSYVVSHLFLKTVFARNRPQRKLSDNVLAIEPWTKNPWDFGNYSSSNYIPFNTRQHNGKFVGNGFPSFHTTFYFSIAKVFQMEYNNYWIPYTLATGVWLSNIKGHAHWVSDILVGGLVGTIIGKSVVNSSRKQIAKKNKASYSYNPHKLKITKQLVPQISSSNVGFHLTATF